MLTADAKKDKKKEKEKPKKEKLKKKELPVSPKEEKPDFSPGDAELGFGLDARDFNPGSIHDDIF